jgi:hypothetical protein
MISPMSSVVAAVLAGSFIIASLFTELGFISLIAALSINGFAAQKFHAKGRSPTLRADCARNMGRSRFWLSELRVYFVGALAAGFGVVVLCVAGAAGFGFAGDVSTGAGASGGGAVMFGVVAL